MAGCYFAVAGRAADIPACSIVQTNGINSYRAKKSWTSRPLVERGFVDLESRQKSLTNNGESPLPFEESEPWG